MLTVFFKIRPASISTRRSRGATRKTWRSKKRKRPEVKDRSSVINISSKQVSEEQLSLLAKGLSFVPVRGNDPFTTKVEMFKFFRSIRLKVFYSKGTQHRQYSPLESGTQEGLSAPKKTFKPKSTFLPPANNSSVETFCRLVEQDVFTCLKSGTCLIKPIC